MAHNHISASRSPHLPLNSRRSAEQLPTQVAAVCYQVRDHDIQFLLVTNKQGRWTFPKGNVGPGTSSTSAALREAREEAGALGQIHPRAFATYLHCKINRRRRHEVRLVEAYLVEVQKVRAPEEWFRRPTWFDAESAKNMLAMGREEIWAIELARVIDSAVHQFSSGRNGLLRWT